MDPLIAAAAQALARGDPLGALNRIALRGDPPALALRGIAMAQLGDLARASELLRRAARRFGTKAPLARARCVLAEAEVALAARELRRSAAGLAAARATLEARGDRGNAAHARLLEARRHLLLGEIAAAAAALRALDSVSLSPTLEAMRQLMLAGIAIRRIRVEPARAALARARVAADRARIPSLRAEIDVAGQALETPVARLVSRDGERLLLLADVEALRASDALIVDGCRHVVGCGAARVPLTTRPVLFALVRALAEAWPGDVAREVLIARAFRGREADESHRARLRVEIGRLRVTLRGLAELRATRHGFVLVTRRARDVIVLAPPLEDAHAAVLALLADGEAWSSSSLAAALGLGRRSVQRALDEVARAGRVRSFGRGRARRWVSSPSPGIATLLLLPAPPTGD